MKIIFLVLLLVALAYSSNLRTNVRSLGDIKYSKQGKSDAEDYCVWFYKKTNYQGSSYKYCSSDNSFGSKDNDYESVKLGSKVEKVEIFVGKDWKDDKYTYTGNKKSFPNGLSGRASSVIIYHEVPSDSVYFYQSINYSGDWILRSRTMNHMKYGGIDLNDEVSSLRLGSEVRNVRMFADEDWEGNSVTVTEDVSDIRDEGNWNDRVSSFNIVHRSLSRDCAKMFTQKHYKGSTLEVCGDFESESLGYYEDDIQSILVGEDVKFLHLYEKKNFKGYNKKYTDNENDLSDITWKVNGNRVDMYKEASSLKIET